MLANVVRQSVDRLLEILDTIDITTNVSCPQRNWVMVLPSLIAGVSLMTVSVVTGLFQWGMLRQEYES